MSVDEDFGAQTIDALNQDQVVEKKAAGAVKVAEEEAKLLRKEREQRHSQRGKLFWVVMALVVLAVVTVIAIAGVSFFLTPKLEAPVLVAVISGLTVQSFSLTAIIATGLYSRRGEAQAAKQAVE